MAGNIKNFKVPDDLLEYPFQIGLQEANLPL
jgi:hypothetical protein